MICVSWISARTMNHRWRLRPKFDCNFVTFQNVLRTRNSFVKWKSLLYICYLIKLCFQIDEWLQRALWIQKLCLILMDTFDHMLQPFGAATQYSWVNANIKNYFNFFLQPKNFLFIQNSIDDVTNPLEYLNGDVKRVNLMFWSFVLIYLFCEMGQSVTNQFEMFEEELCRRDWYLFPLKLQRIHLIVLANAQQPTTLNGFANLVCIRESMKTVINYDSKVFDSRGRLDFNSHFFTPQTIKASFSYFMTLRQFDWIVTNKEHDHFLLCTSIS